MIQTATAVVFSLTEPSLFPNKEIVPVGIVVDVEIPPIETPK